MGMHETIKTTITEHKNEIELIQWALTASISSLVYSEYLRNFKQKQVPVRRIFVPKIHLIEELLKSDGEVCNWISEKFVDIMKEELPKIPEFVLFNEENSEIMKTIMDLYILPNIGQRISNAIRNKFQLGDENNKIFIESNELNLFGDNHLLGDHYDYLVEEFKLQLYNLIPSIEKSITLVESNENIRIENDDILTINNEYGICPIYININIINNLNVWKILKFVTSTEAKFVSSVVDESCAFELQTNVFNQVAIVQYKLNRA